MTVEAQDVHIVDRSGTSGIDTLLAHLEHTSISERAKGDSFERLIKGYLVTEPLYAALVDEVWMWNEWPYQEGNDAGIDLVAHTRNDEYWAIQCKFYAATHILAKADIDSFFTASGQSFVVDDDKRVFSKRLIFTTTNHWPSHIHMPM